MSKLSLIFTLLLGLTACSNQHREADPDLSDAELSSLLEEFNIPGFNAEAVDTSWQTISVYHAGSNEDRPAHSVLAVFDMAFFDSTIQESNVWSRDAGLSEVDVLFVEQVNGNDERRYLLGIRMKRADGDPFYFTAETNSPDAVYADDSHFEATLDSQNGSILVDSNDIHERFDGELGDAAKLYISVLGEGGAFYIGQISTMARYTIQ